MSGPSCLSCEAFHPIDGPAGQCRRRSPVPQMIMTQGITGPVPQVIGMWPGVSQGDWCKEHFLPQNTGQTRGLIT